VKTAHLFFITICAASGSGGMEVIMKDYFNGGMLPNDIINLFRVQKHDFLNYFQVILGYLQLERYDDALNYTRDAINTIQENGSIMKLNTINLSMLIMNLMQKMHAIGIEPKLTISTMLENIEEKDEENLCKMIDMLWKIVTAQLLRCNIEERYLEIDIRQAEDSYKFSFKFSYNENTIFNKEIQELKDYVSFYNIDFEAKGKNGFYKIFMEVKNVSG
jgi:hypothetical protein